ncbi:MAG: chromate resistance protein [Chloroflexi bacterium]|nr:chromate resistance protein [Chloroflexota bacterium]MCI0575612.1 chromate resistance protein [Chloroflexota bacterium]MCI0645051.1 chromate resistance protein [Chloroflexota bacterium]MCI0731887.1 chromate resistance protein [Chloroflexota bacterium]
MQWVVFSYSLPSGSSSTPRVTLWRRLRRLGAISPTGNAYILPSRDECLEAFQWLAREMTQAGGEALVMHVQQFEGLDEGQLASLFNQARQEEYAAVTEQLDELERQVAASDDPATLQSALDKIQRQYAEIARVDYFHSPQGPLVAGQLERLAQRLAPAGSPVPVIAPATVARYRDKRWVTRPRPHVDRLACAWLIRRYLNPRAVIRYAQRPEPGEIAFDMNEGEFSHQGNLCTFEVMLRAFTLDEVGLSFLAEIVHEIDLRDGRYQRPETSGVDAVLRGWYLADVSDAELETRGIALFEGLYKALATQVPGMAQPQDEATNSHSTTGQERE